MEISAPHPNKRSSTGWTIELRQWIPDNDDFDENGGTATSENILDCHLPQPPTADMIVGFLNLGTEQPDLLTSWAKTPVGEPLINTVFIVADRHDQTTPR